MNSSKYSYLKSIANSKTDRHIIDNIIADRKSIINDNIKIKDKTVFPLNLDEFTFFLSKNNAPSSIDTLVEIFRDRTHMKLSEFTGKNDEIVLDLGANEGYYSIAMTENNQNLKILALEPLEENYKLLNKNIKENNLKNIKTFQTAISDTKGKIHFETYPHISTVASENILKQKRVWMDQDKISKHKVNSTTLYDFFYNYDIRNIDILKMDVEGSETSILKNSSSILKKIKKIVVETHDHSSRKECKYILKSSGFKCLYEEKYRFGDIYFKNKNYF